MDERGLPAFLAGLTPRWRGLSVTAPLKRAVVGLVDRASPLVRTAGIANTVLIGDAGERLADNTDVPGMLAALAEQGVSEAASPLVLGGGATAASALVALAQLGSRSATVCLRDESRAREIRLLAHRLQLDIGVRPLSELPTTGTDVTVSTIPADAAAVLAEQVAERSALVLDAVYNPWPTPLALAASRRGRRVVTGLDLLVHQAALQVELMTGCAPAPLAQLRAVVHSRAGSGPESIPAG